MSRWIIALRALLFNRRINIAVALGVAAATAVLTGALIVGESMRGSLRDLTLDRLGKIDVVLASSGYFKESLELYRRDKANQSDLIKVPVIFFSNASAETAKNQRRASNVSIIGCRQNFWSLYPDSQFSAEISKDGIVINQTLADDLGIDQQTVDSGAAKITIGIPSQTLLPSDSSLADKDDLFERIVDLKVVKVIPSTGPGRFGLHPTQLPPRNAFVSIETLQNALAANVLKYKSNQQQANLMLVASKIANPVELIKAEASPSIEDLGLRIKRVTQTSPSDNVDALNTQTVFDYFSVSSDRLVLDDQVADTIRRAFPAANDVFVYMANEINLKTSEKPGIPFSIVASVDFDDKFKPVSAVTGEAAKPLEENEIALNEWAANDLKAKVGDVIKLTYFEPESTHGEEVARTAEFVVADILKLTTPLEPFESRPASEIVPAIFDSPPTLVNDPDMTPEVPGLTDAQSIEDWDLPFATADKLRAQDDTYWENFRTTPKAFVSLVGGRKLWSSRFGDTTSFRVPVDGLTDEQVAAKLISQFKLDGNLGGLQLISIKQQGLKASSGATPFDVLFLMLSIFVIGSALILVSLLFKLGIEQRSDEVGLLRATGFTSKSVARIWLMESAGVCLIGAIVGAVLGVGYAWLMLLGLRTWWVGAVSTPFLQMHLSWWVLPAGIVLGLLVCIGTIFWTIRRTARQPAKDLLSGRIENSHLKTRRRAWLKVAAGVLVVLALVMAAVATQLAGEKQAIAFMSSGFLVLVALLALVWLILSGGLNATAISNRDVFRLGVSNARRNPLRSTLTIGLVAVAAFLILAISAFRLSPTEQGTAGFDFVAQTSQPVFEDLNSIEGRQKLLGSENSLAEGSSILSLRFKTGEDASCNNLYQATQPRVLGVPPSFIEHFDKSKNQFAWFADTGTSDASQKNPWHVLESDGGNVADGSPEHPIPCVIDKNTAWYNLKVYLPGQTFKVDFDSGQSVTFRLAGLLDNTVLQGSLLVGEHDFVKVFPDIGGYRFFLVESRQGSEAADLKLLSSSLGDQGFEARSANEMLAGFLAVQNTYLSTFQSLGALGLLLGTFGLVAVQLRAVFERRKELAVMRAVGFSNARLGKLVLIENVLLLLSGLGTGIIAALFATVPFMIFGRASIPWTELVAVFAVISVVGLGTSWLASRSIQRAPLVQSLRV